MTVVWSCSDRVSSRQLELRLWIRLPLFSTWEYSSHLLTYFKSSNHLTDINLLVSTFEFSSVMATTFNTWEYSSHLLAYFKTSNHLTDINLLVSTFEFSSVMATTFNTNLLLTVREGRTGEYWPEVVAVRTERSEVRTKTTEGQYSPVRLEQARLVSSLLYGTRSKLVYL